MTIFFSGKYDLFVGSSSCLLYPIMITQIKYTNKLDVLNQNVKNKQNEQGCQRSF